MDAIIKKAEVQPLFEGALLGPEKIVSHLNELTAAIDPTPHEDILKDLI